jgi:hypothetical protein
LQSRFVQASMLRDAFAIADAHLSVSANQTRLAQALRCVNTSLSGKLFFSSCWCIRDEVHSIPECTQRLKPSHTSEGNMAKKAKKAKKAKSAVKKTAKKTRKVAKNKK